jgi:uncharacterized protein YjbI with pentapeptide repeats
VSWLFLAGVGLALIVLIALAYRHGWRWTGFADKTLWDWLQLLVIPIALAALAFLLNDAQSDREQRREDERAARERAAAADAAREEALRGYLTQMSELMLDRNLLQSRLAGRGADVQAVARTITLTTVRRLDGERKGVVLRFLAESNLIDQRDFKVELNGANLRSADLRLAPLRGTFLRGVNLKDADLRRAFLAGAYLHLSDLRDADLRRADLRGAFLGNTDLRGADLRGPDVRVLGDPVARLGGINLEGAEFDSTTRWPDGFDPVAAGAKRVEPPD